MTRPAPFKSSLALPVAVLLIAMVSTQSGSALAKGLFARAGAPGAAALRLALASILLTLVWRPWRLRPSAREARNIVLYGIAMGTMNCCFYLALNRIPLGIAVALEFTGPLAVALFSSHRALDFAWVALAALGIVALLPLASSAGALAPDGILYALAAGVCWALYIVFGQRTGSLPAGQKVALGMLIGAVLIVPIGVASAGRALLAPSLWPTAAAVALLASALPYTLEMFALMRMPARTFGVLMSLEPALGALAGLAFLGEHLRLVQWFAVASIVLASAGIASTSQAASSASLAE